MTRAFHIAAVAGLLLAPLGSAPAAGRDAKSTAKARDPNQRICEDVTMLGSRLGTKRFCATRAEWEDKKRQDREAVDKAQVSPCVLTHNAPSGRQAC